MSRINPYYAFAQCLVSAWYLGIYLITPEHRQLMIFLTSHNLKKFYWPTVHSFALLYKNRQNLNKLKK